jgi:hypothetical protein
MTAAVAAEQAWTPELRDRVAKLVGMLGSGAGGECENAARALAREVDLHALAHFIRHADAPGAGDAFHAACRPFFMAALGEVRAASWALSGNEPSELRAVVSALGSGGRLDAAAATTLWKLHTAIKRRVRDRG